MPYKFKKGGTVEEAGAREIPLSLSKENLKQLLIDLINRNSQFSDQDFANWCSQHFTNIFANDLELESMGIDEVTYEVLNDIDAQWDLYLVNIYKIEDLQTMDISKVKLPEAWLKNWLSQLD